MSVLDTLRNTYNLVRWSNLKAIYRYGVPGARWSGYEAGRESRRRARERRRSR